MVHVQYQCTDDPDQKCGKDQAVNVNVIKYSCRKNDHLRKRMSLSKVMGINDRKVSVARALHMAISSRRLSTKYYSKITSHEVLIP